MADWAAIVREHGPLVWRTAYRLLGQHADASDCFQETLVSAMEVAARQSVENWPGLLLRLATSRALDQLRKRVRETSRCEVRVDCDAMPAHGPDPVQQAQANELAAHLRLALAKLPPQQSEVFCLRQISGLSYQDISAQMGISIDAVGVHLHLARGRLRELLSIGREDERKES